MSDDEFTQDDVDYHDIAQELIDYDATVCKQLTPRGAPEALTMVKYLYDAHDIDELDWHDWADTQPPDWYEESDNDG